MTQISFEKKHDIWGKIMMIRDLNEIEELARWLDEQSLIYSDYLQSRSGSKKLSRAAELLLQNQKPVMIPKSERPILKSNPFNDELGRCWCGTKTSVDQCGDTPIEYPASWEFREPCPQDDCLLPADAIPQP